MPSTGELKYVGKSILINKEGKYWLVKGGTTSLRVKEKKRYCKNGGSWFGHISVSRVWTNVRSRASPSWYRHWRNRNCRSGGKSIVSDATSTMNFLPKQMDSRLRGRWSIGWLNALPRKMNLRVEGRRLIGWLNNAPTWRRLRKGGRLSTGWLNEKWEPNFKWVREECRWSTGALKRSPNVRWVKDDGRLSTPRRKEFPQVRCVMELGRFTSWQLNASPRVIWVTVEG